MNHLFKIKTSTALNLQTRILLAISGFLSVAVLLLAVEVLRSHERWVILPMSNPDHRIELSTKGYGKSYLKAWGMQVMETLLTTTKETVKKQVAELEAVSAKNSLKLSYFFKEHIRFIEGSDVESVFFPKEVKALEEGRLEITGQFRYWMGQDKETISISKTYHLRYKIGPRGVLLLTNIKEVNK